MRIKPPAFPFLALSTKLVRAAAAAWPTPFASTRPTQVEGFGTNPGELKMYLYAPPRLQAGRPLVVLLHGCGQSASGFASDAGWIALAQHYRFALLLPEQTRSNNRMGCFNWFRPEDARRDSGEVKSIRQMIRRAVKRYGSDPRRIFVAGFSAGGAMAAALLAAYPALFAAGGIFAGMPVGCASNGVGGLIRMRRAGSDLARENLARAVSNGEARRSWPRISIWQGEKDHTVDPKNAEVLAAQWSQLHGFGAIPNASHTETAFRRRCWGKPRQSPQVEIWTLPAMGHAYPLDPKKDAGGRLGGAVADAGVSGTHMLAAFWGLEPPKR